MKLIAKRKSNHLKQKSLYKGGDKRKVINKNNQSEIWFSIEEQMCFEED